jgi:NADPH:quinone reductase-like Zn-dependent oxidoreductase
LTFNDIAYHYNTAGNMPEPSSPDRFPAMSAVRNRGVIKVQKGVAAVQDLPFPELRDDYLLVKTKVIALNPADWQAINEDAGVGCLVGVDYSGSVMKVGKDVKKEWKVGDRIAGIAHGGMFEIIGMLRLQDEC